jgi:glycosyltransferase involved in cell wall biosynthesis
VAPKIKFMPKQSDRSNLPLFSVIIPTYNRGYIIRDAIESVLSQGIDEVEIILIDDGSVDNTKELIGSYEEKIVYQYQANQGISAARNKGISISKGKYISFLDSDDIFLPGKMKRELDLFGKFPDADVIFADADLFKDGKKLEFTYMVKRHFMFESKDPYYFDNHEIGWIKGSMFPVCSMTLHRRVLETLGSVLYDTGFPSSEDWDLEIRLIHHCKLIIDSEVTSLVRRFNDDTRMERNLGHENFKTSVLFLILKKRILEKALSLDKWPEKTICAIKSKLDELYTQISKHHTENA